MKDLVLSQEQWVSLEKYGSFVKVIPRAYSVVLGQVFEVIDGRTGEKRLVEVVAIQQQSHHSTHDLYTFHLVSTEEDSSTTSE